MAFQAEVELENSQRAPIPVVSSLKYGLLEDGESKLFIELIARLRPSRNMMLNLTQIY